MKNQQKKYTNTRHDGKKVHRKERGARPKAVTKSNGKGGGGGGREVACVRGLSIGATQARPGSDGKEREREAKQLQTMSQHFQEISYTQANTAANGLEREETWLTRFNTTHHRPAFALRGGGHALGSVSARWRRAECGD